VIFAILLICSDLLSKYLAHVYSSYIYNSGVAFSIGASGNLAPVVFLLLNLGVGTALLTYLICQTAEKSWAVKYRLAFLLIACGALGNALDRLFCYFTSGNLWVTDFIRYGSLFTGNIADIFVVLGCVIFAIQVVLAH
jgi:signal peptidase II